MDEIETIIREEYHGFIATISGFYFPNVDELSIVATNFDTTFCPVFFMNLRRHATIDTLFSGAIALLILISVLTPYSHARAQDEDTSTPAISEDRAPQATPQIDPSLPSQVDTTKQLNSTKQPESTQYTAEKPATTKPCEPIPNILTHYEIDSIEVRGNHSTSANTIRSRISIKKGDSIPAHSTTFEEIEWQLLSTGWFRKVEVNLAKRRQRGHVRVIITVIEQNTIVVNQLGFGVSEGLNDTDDRTVDLNPYLSVDIAESNLFGTGMTFGGTALISLAQQGFRFRFRAPKLIAKTLSLRTDVFFNNARQFFGNSPLVSIRCPANLPIEECPSDVIARSAVVVYDRGGLMLGLGWRWAENLTFAADWQFGYVDVTARPEAASDKRPSSWHPIDFAIQDNQSFVSTLRFKAAYDTRDRTLLTMRGTHLRFAFDISSPAFGSTYKFIKFQANLRHWFELAPRHSIRASGFLGSVFGDAPFFWKFHISDLSDLIPSRSLDMELDRRSAPNFFGNAIHAMRNEEIAWRLDLEYNWLLSRDENEEASVRGSAAYLNIGVLSLMDYSDRAFGITGYSGAERYPVDLTFDIGIRLQTKIGSFQFGLSTVVGFIAL